MKFQHSQAKVRKTLYATVKKGSTLIRFILAENKPLKYVCTLHGFNYCSIWDSAAYSLMSSAIFLMGTTVVKCKLYTYLES